MASIPCPTCGASGDELCVRGRKPNGGGGIFGAVWRKQIPFPEGHDSRRSAEMQHLKYLLEMADAIGQSVAAGILPPQDSNGFYLI
jgi:hypothetical protein